jgi:hypothetical protein
MHAHPPLQFSDVISPAPQQPPGETDLGAAKISFKRAGEKFSDPDPVVTWTPEIELTMSAYPHRIGRIGWANGCAGASLEAEKLFSPALKISALFLSGFLSSKRKELGERT